MKERSIGITLRTRYICSVIFYISMAVYGVTSILIYGKTNAGIAYSGLAILVFLIAMFCILIQSEALVKKADPLNKYNQRKYFIILAVQLLEMFVVYIMSTMFTQDKKNSIGILFFGVITVVCYGIMQIHRRIYAEYERLKESGAIYEILVEYNSKKAYTIDIDSYYKKFFSFMFYLISLVFVYRYTLYHWGLTLVFIVVNICVIWKMHWNGISYFVKHSKIYFVVICISSTIGIILLKNIYDGNIVLELFSSRDEHEYLMVFILFYLPLTYYGKKLSEKYNTEKYSWVE